MIWGLRNRGGQHPVRTNKGEARGTAAFAPALSRLLPGGPLVSIVLPVYNQAGMLAESVSSILSEREIPLELIIVDDGSTDDPASAVRSFRESDTRVRFLTKPNGGISSALNAGFAVTEAPLLTWTSADNRYLPGGLRALVLDQLAHSCCPLSYGNVRLIDEAGRPARKSAYRPSDQSPTDPSILLLPRSSELLFEFDDNFINAAFLYRRTFAENVGVYLSALRGYEDYDYWLRLTAFAPARHVDTADPLYEYRVHGNSLTGRLDPAKLASETRAHRLRMRTFRNKLLSEQPATTAPAPESVLKRARDSHFGAVCASGEVAGIIGGAPESELLGALKGAGKTAAIFVTSPGTAESWRACAAPLGFPVIADFPEGFGELTEKEYRQRSLMFFLSSIDWILHVQGEDTLREQALYAAHAGLTLRSFMAGTSGKMSSRAVEFLPAPHVEFYGSTAELLSAPAAAIPPSPVLDEWILSTGEAHRLAISRTGALCSQVERIAIS